MKSSWPVHKLGKYTLQQNLRNKNLKSIKVFSVTNSEGFVISTDYFSKKVFSKNLSNYKIVIRNQFAYNPSRINVGSIDYLKIDDSVLISPLYIVFEVNNSKLSSEYLLRFLKSDYGGMQIKNNTQGAVRDSLKYKGMENINIPIPPLNDQLRIASILSRAENLIAKRKESIELLDELLKSTFLDMFGDPVKNEKGWDIHLLKNLCGFITKGTTPKRNDVYSIFEKGFIPFLKVYHIDDDGSIKFNYNPSFITDKIHQEYLKRSVVYPNDVLMNIVGPPLGKIGIVPETYKEWNVNQAIAIFRCGENLNPRYLLYTLKSKNLCNSIIKMAVGIRQLNLSLEQCRNINIPVPPLPLQAQFETIVIKIESLKSKYQQSLTELENLYGALSQRAFKGELDLSKIPIKEEPKPIAGTADITLPAMKMEGEMTIQKPLSKQKLLKIKKRTRTLMMK